MSLEKNIVEQKIEDNEINKVSSEEQVLDNKDMGLPKAFKDMTPEEKKSYQDQKIEEIQKRIDDMNSKLEESNVKLQTASKIIDLKREIDLTEEEHVKILKQKIELQDSIPSSRGIQHAFVSDLEMKEREKESNTKVSELEIKIEDFMKNTENFKQQIQDLKEKNFGNKFARVDSYTQDSLRQEIGKLEDKIEQDKYTLEGIKSNNS